PTWRERGPPPPPTGAGRPALPRPGGRGRRHRRVPAAARLRSRSRGACGGVGRCRRDGRSPIPGPAGGPGPGRGEPPGRRSAAPGAPATTHRPIGPPRPRTPLRWGSRPGRGGRRCCPPSPGRPRRRRYAPRGPWAPGRRGRHRSSRRGSRRRPRWGPAPARANPAPPATYRMVTCPALRDCWAEVTTCGSGGALDGGHDRVGELVAVFGPGGPPEGEAEALSGLLEGPAHGGQHVAGGARPGLAGGAGGSRHPRPVEADQDGLVAGPGDADVGVLDEPAVLGSVDDHIGAFADQPLLEPPSRLADVAPEPFPVGDGQLEGGGEAHGSGDVVGAGAAAQLLAASVEDGLEE